MRYLASSPLRRGYFRLQNDTGRSGPLFPAQAGVFPTIDFHWENHPPLPRSGGGISICALDDPGGSVSSPLRRGYFLLAHHFPDAPNLFPAQAGVFPSPTTTLLSTPPLPRSGGGISIQLGYIKSAVNSSPLRRGYFPLATSSCSRSALFPAQAGVFPYRAIRKCFVHSLPRSGGGISRHQAR